MGVVARDLDIGWLVPALSFHLPISCHESTVVSRNVCGLTLIPFVSVQAGTLTDDITGLANGIDSELSGAWK